jgi:aerobic C4-dicarboxylate transport protein
VTGAGFITLAATLAVVPDIPIAALAVLVGVDRFMSECRALTNLVGNGVATLAVAAWEKQLDRDQLNRELSGGPAPAEADERAFRPVDVPTPAPRRSRAKAPTPIKPKPLSGQN